MSAPTTSSSPTRPVRFTPADCRLDDLRAVVEVGTDRGEHPCADAVESGVLVHGERLRERAGTAEGRRDVQAELARRCSTAPASWCSAVRSTGRSSTGPPRSSGRSSPSSTPRASRAVTTSLRPANDRVWGALDEFALRAPEAFADYYGCDVLALVTEAWLGPGYQVTSQVNVVNPGGTAQVAHRDHHLGFMSPEQAQAHPAHAHLLSPALTLQGAVAHCDMPVETGPTRYLPHSQKYPPGYLALHRPEFSEYVEAHGVQLPLHTGDAAFFNPAVLHGAGTNRTADVERMANLLQVSSAFGRAMETVDRTAVSAALFPVLARRRAAGAAERELRAVVAAAAEGYAFPTNLDRDQPVGGLAPQTQAELLWQAVEEGWSAERLGGALAAQQERRRTG